MTTGSVLPPLRLPPEATAAGQARRYVIDVLTSAGRNDVLDAAVVGVSELITNACLHARSTMILSVMADHEGPVRIEVSDDSPVMPVPRRHSATATTGRGLRLLDAAGRWGVESNPGGKTVWFEPADELTPEPFFDVGGEL